ncbi:MAG: hypothetical protein DRO11_04190 [Methanobacteriota archaeon]|nr:MAG: hypothetical protein DRO11_04190 [Euryarchaeota archaeon]
MPDILSTDRKETVYEQICHLGYKFFGSIAKEPKNPEIREAIEFTGLKVTPRETEAGAIFASILAGFLLFLLTLLSFLGFLPVPWYLMGLLSLGLAMGVYAYMGEYPKLYANLYRIQAIGSMPELINNLVISLKLVPNLENAVSFASKTTRGHMGLVLKRLAWETLARSYNSAEQALTQLAERWKRWNDDFARALYLIRTSLEEKTEKRRIEVLDKAVDTILRGTSEKMDQFASSLYMPTMALYFIGVIIPLIMVVLLPVLAFTGTNVGAKHMFIIYDVVLPVAMFAGTSWVLNHRPVTLPPPDIGEHPELPPEGKLRINLGKPLTISGKLLGMVVATPLIFFGLIRLKNLLGEEASKALETQTLSAETTGLSTQQAEPLFQSLDLTILILVGLALGLFIYMFTTNWGRFKVREKIIETEREFIDSLTQLGNRLSDGKPIEDAITHVSRVMGGSGVSKIFSDAARLITVGRMSIRQAFFDEKEGALRYVYSDTIRNVLHKIVEGVEKGSETASITVFRTIDQLRRVQTIEREMRKRLDEVVTPMRVIIIFVGPLIAGVVVVLQRVINSYTSKFGFTPGAELPTTTPGMPINIQELGKLQAEFAAKTIEPGVLIIIVGIYLLLMVLILSRYMAGITHGDDKVAMRVEMGKNAVISITIFILAMVGLDMFF